MNTFPNGDQYEGDWKNGVMDGIGTYRYKNKDVYIGEYKNNSRQGNGIYKYANGNM